MDIFEITVQRRLKENVWPVVVNKKSAGELLPTRTEGELVLSEADHEKLTTLLLEPKPYGTVLGKALFVEGIRDEFVKALNSDGGLRVMLQVEDQELRQLRWERLCAPMGQGDWDHLALNERTLFSHYLPSATDPHFTPIGRRDLRALVLVASPEKTDQEGFPAFDVEKTVASVKASLGSISCDVLANTEGTQGAPTLNELIGKLTDPQTHYTILHIVCHGKLTPKGHTILYWATAENQIVRLNVDNFIERLKKLDGNSIPHFVFLCTCESASPDAEDVGCLGGLAQRLIREVGIPAVVAMTEKITIETAQILASSFYKQLRSTGYVDTALVGAATQLADRPDVTVPALFSRLGDQPLFRDKLDRDLTKAEIEYGLKCLPELFQERAPVLKETIEKQAAPIRATLGAELAALSPAAREQRQNALKELNQHCVEVLDLSFNALALEQLPPTYDSRCPFKGLSSFHSEDQQFFFGREELVETLKQMLKEHHFLAVLGPSGSGKSSVILAGLIPLIQKEEGGFEPVYMTPTSNPVAQLTASLEKSPGQLQLLIIDQFEELFTLCTDKAVRQNFVEKLLEQIQIQKRRVVITMRADFWGECAPFQELKELMTARQKLIAPMDSTELRDAMDKQASAVGLRFEADLANTLLEDVNDEPGAMPLLQHALRELWKRRHGKWLLAEEYRNIGTVKKAIANTADEIYQSFKDPQDQTLVRNIFIRLTHLDSEAEILRDTRKRVQLDKLVPAGVDSEKIKRIVSVLAGENSRLVVTSVNQRTNQDEVEVTHEALIHYWSMLHAWLKDNRKDLLLRERISQEAEEWSKSKKHDTLMLRGGRLEDAANLVKRPEFGWNETEIKYVNACVRNQRKATVLLSLGLIVTFLIAVIALWQRDIAETQKKNAEINALNSEINAMALKVKELLASGLSIEALEGALELGSRLKQTNDLTASTRLKAIVALHQVVGRVQELNHLGHDNWVQEASFSSDGKWIASASYDGVIKLWDFNGQEILLTPYISDFFAFNRNFGNGYQFQGKKMAFSPDNQAIAYATEKSIRILPLKNGKPSINLPTEEYIYSLCFYPEPKNSNINTLAASGEDGGIKFWSIKDNDGQLLRSRSLPVIGDRVKISINPDGNLLFAISEKGMARLWKIRIVSTPTGSDVETYPISIPSSLIVPKKVTNISFSPEGNILAIVGDNTVQLWDLGNLNNINQKITIRGAEGTRFMSVAFGHLGDDLVIAAGSQDGMIQFWRLDGTPILTILKHGRQIFDVGFSPDGKLLASAGDDNNVKLWSVASLEKNRETRIMEVKGAISVSPTDQALAHDCGSRIELFDLKSLKRAQVNLESIDSEGKLLNFSKDGKLLVAFGNGSSIQVWQLPNYPYPLSSDSSWCSPPQSESIKPFFKKEVMDKGIVYAAAFNPDGTRLVSGHANGSINIWSLSDQTLLRNINGSNNWINALQFSPDGKWIASGGADRKIYLWDAEKIVNSSNIEPEPQILGQVNNQDQHSDVVQTIQFSKDGKTLISGSWDKTIKIWDVETKKLKKYFDGTSK